MIPNLIRAIREKNWNLTARYVATIVVIVLLGTGMVTLSGCGQAGFNYSSGPTPEANKIVIERIQEPADSPPQSQVVIPK